MRQLIGVLTANGATVRPDGFKPAEVTHIVARTPFFTGRSEALQLMVPVVSPDWVGASIEARRLKPVRGFQPAGPATLLRRWEVYVNLPEESDDAAAVHYLIDLMGGHTSLDLRRSVNLVISDSLDDDISEALRTMKSEAPVVTVDWQVLSQVWWCGS